MRGELTLMVLEVRIRQWAPYPSVLLVQTPSFVVTLPILVSIHNLAQTMHTITPHLPTDLMCRVSRSATATPRRGWTKASFGGELGNTASSHKLPVE